MPDGPERVDSSKVLQGAKNSFSQMRSAADVAMMEASAPPISRILTDAIVASGKVRGTDAPVKRKRETDIVDVPFVREVQAKTFVRGARVTAISGQGRGKKLTIIAANAGHTKNTHTPVHRVADEKGNVWLEVETKLKFR